MHLEPAEAPRNDETQKAAIATLYNRAVRILSRWPDSLAKEFDYLKRVFILNGFKPSYIDVIREKSSSGKHGN